MSTRTPAMAEFAGPDGGKTARDVVRWPSTRGGAGPWSETASETIGVCEAVSRQRSAEWSARRLARRQVALAWDSDQKEKHDE